MSPGEKSLGELVRELRERQGLTQAQLAERAQLALSYITLAESGQKVNLAPSALGRLARALAVPSKVLTDAAVGAAMDALGKAEAEGAAGHRRQYRNARRDGTWGAPAADRRAVALAMRAWITATDAALATNQAALDRFRAAPRRGRTGRAPGSTSAMPPGR